MPLRIRPRVRIAKGLHANIGKKGISLTGRSGRVSTTVGKDGVRRSVRLAPGVSYTKKLGCALPLAVVGLVGAVLVWWVG